MPLSGPQKDPRGPMGSSVPPSGHQGHQKDTWVGSQGSYEVICAPQWTPRTPVSAKGDMGWIPVVLWGHPCLPVDTKDPKRTQGLDPRGPMGSSVPPSGPQEPQKETWVGSQWSYGLTCAPPVDPKDPERTHGLDPSGPMGSPMVRSGPQGPQKDPWVGSQWSYGVTCVPQWTPRTPKGHMGWIPVVLWGHPCPAKTPKGPMGSSVPSKMTPRDTKTPKGPQEWIPVVLRGHL